MQFILPPAAVADYSYSFSRCSLFFLPQQLQIILTHSADAVYSFSRISCKLFLLIQQVQFIFPPAAVEVYSYSSRSCSLFSLPQLVQFILIFWAYIHHSPPYSTGLIFTISLTPLMVSDCQFVLQMTSLHVNSMSNFIFQGFQIFKLELGKKKFLKYGFPIFIPDIFQL